MKQLSMAILAAGLALGLASAPAYADFIIVEEKPAAQQQSAAQEKQEKPAAALDLRAPTAPVTTAVARPAAPSAASMSSASRPGRLIQAGAPAPGPAVQGWADDVPMAIALEQLIPQGWRVSLSGVDTNWPVSWRGGRSWHLVLGDLAYGYRFDAKIDWAAQQVIISPPGTAVAQVAGVERKESHAPTPEVATASAAAPSVALAPAVVAAPPVAAPVEQIWRLEPRKTLRENIEAWAKQAGWNSVVWEGADYPVVAPAVFKGSFDSRKARWPR